VAEVPQYSWGAKELLELLIRAADLHEGHWILSLQVNTIPLGAPLGIINVMTGISIQRAPEPLPANAVDAAKLNPARGRRTSSDDKAGVP
jgi:hypothetical protein